MREQYIVVDGTWLAYRSAFAFGGRRSRPDLPDDESIVPGAIEVFMSTISALENVYGPCKFVFCWDSAHSVRRDAFPDYKRHDEPGDDHIANVRTQARKAIKELQYSYLIEKGYVNSLSLHGLEADDVIAVVLRQIARRRIGGFLPIVVSSDNDLLQLLNNCVILKNADYSSGKVYTATAFLCEWGIPPVRWAEVKAIAGCRSDCVPGIPGVGERTAAKYLAGELNPASVKYRLIAEMKDAVMERNLGLVKLPHAQAPDEVELLEEPGRSR